MFGSCCGRGGAIFSAKWPRWGRIDRHCLDRSEGQAGAKPVPTKLFYTKQDFEAEVKRITDGKGLEVVYDAVGKDTFEKSSNSPRPRGLAVLYGQSSGAVPPIDSGVLNAKGSPFSPVPASVITS